MSPTRATPEPMILATTTAPIANTPTIQPAVEAKELEPTVSSYAPPQRITTQVGGKTFSFRIDPEYLEEAAAIYEEIILDENDPDTFDQHLERVQYHHDLQSASNIVCLRLAADLQTAELIGLVLAEYPNLEAQRLVEAEKVAHLAQQKLLAKYKDVLISSFAVEAMLDEEGAEPSAEQEAFMEQTEDWFEAFSEEWGEDTSVRPWYVNEGVIETLQAVLTPAQFDELLTYRAEKEHRKIEQSAYERSMWVAQATGLNEADRSALFQYLQDHPKASNEDIEAMLAPELRALMPRRGCGTCF